ncbi:hypothetical protein GDO81_019141, partial [Engystomops pustulosus]
GWGVAAVLYKVGTGPDEGTRGTLDHTAPLEMPPLPLILLVVFTTQVVDSYDVLCFIQFDEKTLQCEDFLGEGISQEDCCLNKKYGFRKDHDSPCQSCQ